jgi:hypothetical protein
MEDSGKVIENLRDGRLRDGRAVNSDEDFRQWFYEYFENLTGDVGEEHVPAEIFPLIIRVMVEWVEAVLWANDPECALETAQSLADAVKHLMDSQKRCIETAVKGMEKGARGPYGPPS